MCIDIWATNSYLSLHVPAQYNSAVVNGGLSFMAQHPTVPSIWIDLYVMFNKLYCTGDTPLPSSQKRFSILRTEFALIDAWRYKYATTKVYCYILYYCFSKSYSTIILRLVPSVLGWP